MNLPLPDANETSGLVAVGPSLKEFLFHVFPASVIDAMAKNEILQIVVFSLFFGVATAAIGEQGKVIIQFMDAAAPKVLPTTNSFCFLVVRIFSGVMYKSLEFLSTRILIKYCFMPSRARILPLP